MGKNRYKNTCNIPKPGAIDMWFKKTWNYSSVSPLQEKMSKEILLEKWTNDWKLSIALEAENEDSFCKF